MCTHKGAIRAIPFPFRCTRFRAFCFVAASVQRLPHGPRAPRHGSSPAPPHFPAARSTLDGVGPLLRSLGAPPLRRPPSPQLASARRSPSSTIPTSREHVTGARPFRMDQDHLAAAAHLPCLLGAPRRRNPPSLRPSSCDRGINAPQPRQRISGALICWSQALLAGIILHSWRLLLLCLAPRHQQGSEDFLCPQEALRNENEIQHSSSVFC